jgi:hypothetical protein
MNKLRPFAFNHPLKQELEHLLSIQGDLHRAKEALQFLLDSPPFIRESGVVASALYTQALVSYVRCFALGRRKRLDRSVFNANPAMLANHNDVKSIRDQHVAHPVGKLERWDILAAATDETSGALGLGVHNWFFAGAALKDLKAFRQLALFVDKQLQARITLVGDALAKQVIGPKATWRSAQKTFNRHVTSEEVYGPTRFGQ